VESTAEQNFGEV